jgi:hypothetical protein
MSIVNSQKPKNQGGFSLPVVVGMGLVVMLLGLTAIASSQNDRVAASAQRSTAQSLNINEVGVARVQALLKRIPGLASREYDPDNGVDEWSAHANEFGNLCGTPAIDEVNAVLGGWIAVQDSGYFKVVRYQPGTTVSTLEVIATNDTETSKADLDANNLPEQSIFSIDVTIPYGQLDPNENPVLWVAEFDDGKNGTLGEGNQKIDGNVLSQDCSFVDDDFDPDKNFPEDTEWKVSANPYIEFPSSPPLPSHITTITNLSTHCSNAKCTALPHSTDTPDPGTTNIYSYLVSDLKMKGTDGLTVEPGKKVRIYVQGDIEIRGAAGISSDVSALQIYGSNGDGINGKDVNYALPGDSTIYTTDAIRLRGDGDVHAFIFSPSATAGVDAGGNDGGFYGAMWVNNWAGPPFGANSNQIIIDVPTGFNWSSLPAELQSPILTIQPYSSWQRQANPYNP